MTKKPLKTRIFETFQKNESSIKRFVSRFFMTENDIEDIVQETFLRAYEAEKQRSIEEPKAYLYRVAHNLALANASRKPDKLTEYLDELSFDESGSLSTESLESSVISQQALGIYCEAIASLRPQCRKAVLLRKVYGWAVKDIAEQMALSVSTVEKHLARGLADCDRVIAARYRDLPERSKGERVHGETS